MKLFITVVQEDDADAVSAALSEQDFRSTRINSAGGFLRRGNVTFLVGVDEARTGDLLDLIRRHATTRVQVVTPVPAMFEPGETAVPYPVEVQVGGATVFVFDVDRFERL